MKVKDPLKLYEESLRCRSPSKPPKEQKDPVPELHWQYMAGTSRIDDNSIVCTEQDDEPLERSETKTKLSISITRSESTEFSKKRSEKKEKSFNRSQTKEKPFKPPKEIELPLKINDLTRSKTKENPLKRSKTKSNPLKRSETKESTFKRSETKESTVKRSETKESRLKRRSETKGKPLNKFEKNDETSEKSEEERDPSSHVNTLTRTGSSNSRDDGEVAYVEVKLNKRSQSILLHSNDSGMRLEEPLQDDLVQAAETSKDVPSTEKSCSMVSTDECEPGEIEISIKDFGSTAGHRGTLTSDIIYLRKQKQTKRVDTSSSSSKDKQEGPDGTKEQQEDVIENTTKAMEKATIEETNDKQAGTAVSDGAATEKESIEKKVEGQDATHVSDGIESSKDEKAGSNHHRDIRFLQKRAKQMKRVFSKLNKKGHTTANDTIKEKEDDEQGGTKVTDGDGSHGKDDASQKTLQSKETSSSQSSASTLVSLTEALTHLANVSLSVADQQLFLTEHSCVRCKERIRWPDHLGIYASPTEVRHFHSVCYQIQKEEQTNLLKNKNNRVQWFRKQKRTTTTTTTTNNNKKKKEVDIQKMLEKGTLEALNACTNCTEDALFGRNGQHECLACKEFISWDDLIEVYKYNTIYYLHYECYRKRNHKKMARKMGRRKR